VLAVPAGETAIDALGDLRAPGTTLAIGAEGVPAGDYTRKVLEGLDGELRGAILANVRSEEPDVAGVVGKLTQGAVDAGFVYTSDVRAADGRLRAVELPPPLDPEVAYSAAVVEDAPHPEAAARFVDGLVGGAGQDALQAAGFEPPPQ
jgi:molybdate transport system substrate-binding protein